MRVYEIWQAGFYLSVFGAVEQRRSRPGFARRNRWRAKRGNLGVVGDGRSAKCSTRSQPASPALAAPPAPSNWAQSSAPAGAARATAPVEPTRRSTPAPRCSRPSGNGSRTDRAEVCRSSGIDRQMDGPFAQSVPLHWRRDRFFRHRHGGVVFFGVPEFVGTTVITVAPGIVLRNDALLRTRRRTAVRVSPVSWRPSIRLRKTW